MSPSLSPRPLPFLAFIRSIFPFEGHDPQNNACIWLSTVAYRIDKYEVNFVPTEVGFYFLYQDNVCTYNTRRRARTRAIDRKHEVLECFKNLGTLTNTFDLARQDLSNFRLLWSLR
jgi:hypothetical protein